jgi:hypothetical protein
MHFDEMRDACQSILAQADIDADVRAENAAFLIYASHGKNAVVPELERRIPVYIAATRDICLNLDAVGRRLTSAYEKVIERFRSPDF